ncbi:polyprenyl diphosphate synthase [Serpentinicella sp. ANB-PHB4]|uniref:polyprenyl diphosphate synthase n=1 Tax=Serpentinicella sp. ANB-PHB4 TaxID=3074076 RepID=UPI0028583537|nr:polyprenyl diphosphate synthase [Serpentinicella sp. ANB-PHB4]MDR5658924.1 polyprenyl diphosphate synthase [Serpentinicella sp. ANB-PHB4]
MRMPQHIGVIPDGNRRWALNRGFTKDKGYSWGLDPGLELFNLCKKLGIKEITYYGFTVDNTKRPTMQRVAFTQACIKAVEMLAKEDASLLVLGNTKSPMFPKKLLPYTERQTFGKGSIKVNFLVNYGWQWDLAKASSQDNISKASLSKHIYSSDISRIDLIIRWGGRRRLSGFLPIQSVYSDFYVIDEYWPDFKPQHLYDALDWYNHQDITLGG